MRRGLTLIEMLLSLALCAAIIAGMAGWMQLSLRPDDSCARIAWERAAEAIMLAISDDLATCDRAPQSSRALRNSAHDQIAASTGELRLRTRSPSTGNISSTEKRYVFDGSSQNLVSEHGGAGGRRRILTDVASFEASIDQSQRILTITLTSCDGQIVTRRFRTP